MLQDMRLGSPTTLQEQSLVASSLSPVNIQESNILSKRFINYCTSWWWTTKVWNMQELVVFIILLHI